MLSFMSPCNSYPNSDVYRAPDVLGPVLEQLNALLTNMRKSNTPNSCTKDVQEIQKDTTSFRDDQKENNQNLETLSIDGAVLEEDDFQVIDINDNIIKTSSLTPNKDDLHIHAASKNISNTFVRRRKPLKRFGAILEKAYKELDSPSTPPTSVAEENKQNSQKASKRKQLPDPNEKSIKKRKKRQDSTLKQNDIDDYFIEGIQPDSANSIFVNHQDSPVKDKRKQSSSKGENASPNPKQRKMNTASIFSTADVNETSHHELNNMHMNTNKNHHVEAASETTQQIQDLHFQPKSTSLTNSQEVLVQNGRTALSLSSEQQSGIPIDNSISRSTFTALYDSSGRKESTDICILNSNHVNTSTKSQAKGNPVSQPPAALNVLKLTDGNSKPQPFQIPQANLQQTTSAKSQNDQSSCSTLQLTTSPKSPIDLPSCSAVPPVSMIDASFLTEDEMLNALWKKFNIDDIPDSK